MDFATNPNKDIDLQLACQSSTKGNVHPFLIAEEGICLHISDTLPQESSSITPYKVGHFLNQNKQIGKFLACSKIIDLELINFLPGQLVKFNVTENGLKLKPLKLQPLSTQEHVINNFDQNHQAASTPTTDKRNIDSPKKSAIETASELIEGIATSLTQKAAQTGLPLCLGVFIPPNNFR